MIDDIIVHNWATTSKTTYGRSMRAFVKTVIRECGVTLPDCPCADDLCPDGITSPFTTPLVQPMMAMPSSEMEIVTTIMSQMDKKYESALQELSNKVAQLEAENKELREKL